MNILFLTLSKIYDINDHDIYQDLMKEFISKGHSVYIVTPIERRYGENTTVINSSGSKILKVKVGNQSDCGFIEKGISTLMIGRAYKNAINRYFKGVKFDLVLYSTPPITLVSLIKSVKKRNKSVTYLMLKDIFPQNAVDIGLMSKKGLIYKYFRRLEKRLYKTSDFIGCMSLENVKYLLSNNDIPKDKVEICPNAIIPQRGCEKDTLKYKKKRDEYGIPEEACVFVYGGNLGKPQGIDYMIDCLKKIKNDQRFYVMIIGDGSEYHKIESFIKSDEPTNIKLLKKLPRNEYFDIMQCADIGMVFLDHRFTIPNFPSRILPYMEYSMPVLCVTDKVTDVGRIAEENNFGWYCPSDNCDCFVQILNKIYTSDIKAMGQRARLFLEKNYTSDVCCKQIITRINTKVVQ